MARRFIRPRLVDLSGNVLRDGWLRVLDPDTAAEVEVFAASAGGSALTQPLTTDVRGEVECWLDASASVDLEWSDSGATKIAATGRTVSFATFTEFAEAASGGASTHADLPDLATSGHPASVISGLGSAALQSASAFDSAGAAAAAQASSQPLDSDLSAIAALSTTTYGRALLTLADAAAARTALALGGAATLNVGTSAGTVAAGDDSRIGSGPLTNPAAVGIGTSVYNLPGVMITTVATTFGPAGNRIYYAPIVVTKPITVTAMYISVAGGGAGTNVAVGLFAATSAMQPTGSALISAAVSTATTGLKTVAVPSVVLQPGVYLTAINPSAGGLAFDVVQGRTPYASGGWHSATFSAPTLVSAVRTYDGALSAVAWDAVSTGSAGLSYPVTFAWTVN